jgi:hypothetical protein
MRAARCRHETRRQTFALRAPRQRTFVTLGLQQVAHRFGNADFALGVAQAGRIITLAVDLCIELASVCEEVANTSKII